MRYTRLPDDITPEMLGGGFFEGWPNPPSPTTHARILQQSAYVVLAIDDETNQVVGFVNAISDGILSAYIPLLEVLPAFRGRGIGTALMERLLEALDGLYMIDLTCDENVQPFYERIGLMRASGMMRRSFDHQPGKSASSDV
jgi:ribosomal protein S18 acetylase RimI-like enzyme